MKNKSVQKDFWRIMWHWGLE